MPRDRREIDRQFLALHKAYLEGDLEGVKRALGDPPGFPNCIQPFDLGMGDDPLGYAIYWSPLPFVERLLDLGADPDYPDPCGFPSLLAIVSAQDKSDRHERLRLLLAHGASVDQRGINDWTPLHHAVALRDVEAVRILLAHGADPAARTRVDDYSTPEEDASRMGYAELVALLRAASAEK
jgi:ankyrin repeat protein